MAANIVVDRATHNEITAILYRDKRSVYIDWMACYECYMRHGAAVVDTVLEVARTMSAKEPLSSREKYSPFHTLCVICKLYYVYYNSRKLFGLNATNGDIETAYPYHIILTADELLPRHGFDPKEFFRDVHNFGWNVDREHIIHKWGWRIEQYK